MKKQPAQKDTSVPPALKQAKWIWPDDQFWDMHHCFALFRKTFDLKTKPRDAILYITADQSYRLYINGEYIARGPARGFQSHWPYDEINVSRHLRKGRNLIAVRAHNPGTGNFQYVFQGRAGLLAALDAGKTRVVTDETWLGRRQPGIRRDSAPGSLQLFAQEHIDLRVEPPDWFATNHDCDAAWKAPSCSQTWHDMPWADLEPRGIPQLAEKWLPAATVIGMHAGVDPRDYINIRDVARFRYETGFAFLPASGSADKIPVPALAENHFVSYLIDFGKTVVGCPAISIPECAGGETIDTLHFETIGENLLPDYIPDKHCRMAFGGRMICRADGNTHEFYHALGFRHMIVTVRNSPRPLTMTVALRWQGYPLGKTGRFSCDDEALNKIWDACAWTQQCCSLDAYVDTPWREQAQWWGDARVQSWNTFHLCGDARLLRRGIAQIAGQTTPEGVTYGHAPTIAHSCILPDFTLIWFLTLWDYYWQTGSAEPFETHLDTVERALGYFEKYSDKKNGLVGYDKRFWLFLDWTELRREGFPSVYNLWLLIALECLALLAEKTRNKAKALALSKWASKIRKSLSRLVTPDGQMRDGFTAGGEIVTTASLHSQVLGLIAAIPGLDEKTILERRLLPYLHEDKCDKAVPSAYWVTYILSFLSERGHGQGVVDFIKRHWARMAEHGTTWENFAPRRADESFSHAWSAHPLFHLMQTLGGVRQAAPDWKSITYKPVFHGTRCDTVIPTPRGLIKSKWRKTGNKIQVELDLPPGMTARVLLFGGKSQTAKGKWRALLSADKK
ncbi:alpha-L-rhamnosidase N-terminal domain-containing protein [Termitidicoccus mucosus]|uniref:Alpha-L-rhamnosidase n=1 Tax=Termitidicoccus mucosus TaxID=1184151 RepID=A0A178ILT1_9BACT|nr:hypothetical protein AW736_05885 [Opitutaceae bacterium TSB47]